MERDLPLEVRGYCDFLAGVPVFGWSGHTDARSLVASLGPGLQNVQGALTENRHVFGKIRAKSAS